MNNEDLGISRTKLRITGTEIRAIFEPVLNEVLSLVMAQIKTSKVTVKAVLLVGGFGQNAYLRDSIRKEVRSSAGSRNTEVIQPKDGYAWQLETYNTAVNANCIAAGLLSSEVL